MRETDEGPHRVHEASCEGIVNEELSHVQFANKFLCLKEVCKLLQTEIGKSDLQLGLQVVDCFKNGNECFDQRQISEENQVPDLTGKNKKPQVQALVWIRHQPVDFIL